jgi:hypothetical protein
MTDVPSQPPSLIEVDSPCMSCGYNLRGLQTDSNCPECGHIISASLRGDLLRFSDPSWLAQLRLGASLKLWAILVSYVFTFVAGFIVVFGVSDLFVLFASLVGSVLGLWGTWCITSQEPRIALTDETLTLRKIIRASAIGSGVGGLLHMVAEFAPLSTLVYAVATVLSFAGLVAAYGELFYFRRFATRVPDPDLVKSTKRLIVVLPIFIVVMVLGFVAVALMTPAFAGTAAAPGGAGTTAAGAAATPTAPATPGAGLGGLALGGMCGFGLFGFVLFLMYVNLLIKYKSAFTTAIAQATGTQPPTDPTNPTSSMHSDKPMTDLPPPTMKYPDDRRDD